MLTNWTWWIGGSIAGLVVYSNLPTWCWVGHRITRNFIANLEGAPLKPLMQDSTTIIKGSSLWGSDGAVIMAEAAALSALRPQMAAAGVKLHAVIHEPHDEEALGNFLKYFNGSLYLDEKKKFFGPGGRKLSIMGLLRLNLYKKVYDAQRKGVEGNLDGDGTLLGAVYVIGPDRQGIIYEHYEMEFGDHFVEHELLDAIESITHFKKERHEKEL